MAGGTVPYSREEEARLEAGLRILARLMIRAHARNRGRLSANGHGDPAEMPPTPIIISKDCDSTQALQERKA